MLAVEQSLQRLRTDYIDLYQIHCWDDGTPIEETLRALNDLISCGKIHYIGVSNVTGWQFQKIIDTCQTLSLNQIISNQAQYSLLCRSTEWELLEVCKREGIAMLPWSPLKGGLLTGKFERGVIPDPSSSRVAWVSADSKDRTNQSHPSLSQYSDSEQYWDLIKKMKEISEAHNASVAQIAIAWLLHQSSVSSVVIGARSLPQLEDNMKAALIELSDDELTSLDEASAEPLPYPYEMVFRLQKGRERK
jgi:aryl-alcohol dehydrogenase-like predicted oxidoreductase